MANVDTTNESVKQNQVNPDISIDGMPQLVSAAARNLQNKQQNVGEDDELNVKRECPTDSGFQLSGNAGGGSGNRTRRGGGRGGNFGEGNHYRNQGKDQRGFRRDYRGDLRGNNGGIGGGGATNRKNDDFMINQRLKNLQGTTQEMETFEQEELKFSSRNRLYIGNLIGETTEDDLKELFTAYGEITETFINGEKNFAFLKLDFRANAERAKHELDGSMHKNRQLRVRFAPNTTAIKVKNLTQHVSNELLYKSFEIFGQIERAVMIVDERGKTTGEGIVEFVRKTGAMTAIKYCSEKCYFLTTSLRPCISELLEPNDEIDGLPEKSIKKVSDFFAARKISPRFADVGSFEHEYGIRWKQLYELYKQKEELMKTEMRLESEKLEAQMEYARYEHETEILREQLRLREQDRSFHNQKWEQKIDDQRMRGGSGSQQNIFTRSTNNRMEQANFMMSQSQPNISSLMDAQPLNSNFVGNSDNSSGAGSGFSLDRKPDVSGRNFGIQKPFPDFVNQNNKFGSGYDNIGIGSLGNINQCDMVAGLGSNINAVVGSNSVNIGPGGRIGQSRWSDQGNSEGEFKRRRF